MPEPIRLLQVTDMHLQASPEIEMRGVNPEQRFEQVMQAVATEPADLLLLTGDLTHHAASAYQRIVKQLQRLSFPSVWIPGNHDLPGSMYAFADQGYGRKVVELGNWRIVLLDSTAAPDGRGGGSLSEPELAFLQTELEQAAETDLHLLLVLHHHPLSVNSAWQDQIMLGNADQFWSIVERSAQVRGVICGHLHQHWQLQRGGVTLFSCPATAAQFKACTAMPQAEDDPDLAGPAYASYELRQEGGISTQIKRLRA